MVPRLVLATRIAVYGIGLKLSCSTTIPENCTSGRSLPGVFFSVVVCAEAEPTDKRRNKTIFRYFFITASKLRKIVLFVFLTAKALLYLRCSTNLIPQTGFPTGWRIISATGPATRF